MRPRTHREGRLEPVRSFVHSASVPEALPWTAISIFSGAGISDFGYQLAGFGFRAQVEADAPRAAVGKPNFPASEWITRELPLSRPEVIERCQRALGDEQLALLTVTPPCQGMSSSNPSRGRRHTDKSAQQSGRNRLILETIPLANALKPRVIVAENVRPVLTLRLEEGGRAASVIEHLRQGLTGYEVFHGVVDVADYGIAQTRRRAVVVAALRSEPWVDELRERGLVPWPRPTHADHSTAGREEWVSVRAWLEGMAYAPLDAKTQAAARSDHPLHHVPFYDDDRYLQISDIPANSGKSAYDNDRCPACRFEPVPRNVAYCPECRGIMRNRPYRVDEGIARLIRGFHSSYRRMHAGRPAPTVTTNTSHVGSDYKIHPWENRVLSALECADLQTVPRGYDWSGALNARRHYLIRNVIGEAFPTYFAYLHGQLLSNLLSGSSIPNSAFASAGKPTPSRSRGSEPARAPSRAA